MKGYTDLEQSKKLTNILPIESADMYYKYVLPKSDRIFHAPEIGNPINSLKWYNEGYTFSGKRKPITLNDYCIPCWSLAALLKVISNIFKYNLDYNGISFILTVGDFEVSNTTAVDACCEMIIKLHELNLL